MSGHKLEIHIWSGNIDVMLDGIPIGKIKGKITSERHDEMAVPYDNGEEFRVDSEYYIQSNLVMSYFDKMNLLDILSDDSKVSS